MPIELLTQREAADLLRCSERQISRHRASGKLAFLKLGGNIRFHRAHVEALLSPGMSTTTSPQKSWQATRHDMSENASELPEQIRRKPSRPAEAA